MTPSPPLSTPNAPCRRRAWPSMHGARAVRTLPAPGAVPVRRRGADAPLRRQAGSALPLLAEAGSVFEHAAVAQLAAEATVTDLRHQSAQACIDLIRSQPLGRALYYQATLTGRIGAVDCEGIADVLDVVRRADQTLDITVIDIKASRRTSVSFCLQVAFYARLLKDALARAAVPVASVRGAILAHGEAGATAALEPFDLALFEDDIERLLTTPDADVLRVLHRPFAIADAHLSAKCDGCPYNALCFIDAAERYDLSVVPCSRPQKNAPYSVQG